MNMQGWHESGWGLRVQFAANSRNLPCQSVFLASPVSPSNQFNINPCSRGQQEEVWAGSFELLQADSTKKSAMHGKQRSTLCTAPWFPKLSPAVLCGLLLPIICTPWSWLLAWVAIKEPLERPYLFSEICSFQVEGWARHLASWRADFPFCLKRKNEQTHCCCDLMMLQTEMGVHGLRSC